jgi:nitrogen regulatory protein PII
VSRAGLTKMTKIEVVVRGTDVPAVRDLFESAGATGFTSLSGVSGLGHHGFHQGGLLFNERDTLALLISVVPDERADAVLAGLLPLLEESTGVTFVSDTYVSRADYFR